MLMQQIRINERLLKMEHELNVLLKNHKKRITKSKHLIFKLLGNHKAMSTLEFYDAVKNDMDRSTFYRIINEFYEIGVARDVVINGVRKIELTEGFDSHHHHLLCKRCGEVVNINDMKLEQYLKLLAKRRGYIHLDHSFEIQGICPACAPSNAQAAQEYAEL